MKRVLLDARMRTAALREGYDSIIVLASDGFLSLCSTGILPVAFSCRTAVPAVLTGGTPVLREAVSAGRNELHQSHVPEPLKLLATFVLHVTVFGMEAARSGSHGWFRSPKCCRWV